MTPIQDTGTGRASNGRSGEGLGPTLGEDVSPEHAAAENARAARERREFGSGPPPKDLPADDDD